MELPQPLRGGMYCPGCGYDMRASHERCPECGMPVAVMRVRSRIPWVHRREVGWVKGYLGTVAKLLWRRPWAFFREAGIHLRRRDLLGFHRVSVALGMLIVTAFITVWMVVFYDGPGVDRVPEAAYWMTPLFALVDRWWGVFPLMLAVHLAIRLTMASYRASIAAWVSPDHRHRRVTFMGFASSALVPVEGVLVGSLVLLEMVREADKPAFKNLYTAIIMAMILLGLAAIGFYAVTTISFVWHVEKGGGRWVKLLWMLFAQPVVTAVIFLVMLLGMFWVCGYVAIGVRSMLL